MHVYRTAENYMAGENIGEFWQIAKVFSLKFTKYSISIFYLEAIYQSFLPKIVQTDEFVNVFCYKVAMM